jgi:hypothetical protein
MKRVIRIGALCVLLALAAPLMAVDFGLFLNQGLSLDDILNGNMNRVSYFASLTPWFSAMLMEDGDLYLSASIGPRYENKELAIMPELLRSEIVVRSSGGGELRFGRMAYTDPLGLIAGGLFDGLQLSQDIGAGTLSAGGWYTGLQYKGSANITVSPRDMASFDIIYDSNNMDTYFAPRRFLGAVNYEHQAIAEVVQLRLAALGQFDMNDQEDEYHSEYLVGRVTLPYRDLLLFDAGAAFELQQTPDKDHMLSMAAELGAAWMLPTVIDDRLSLVGRFGSGRVEDTPLASFMPLTTVTQGRILKAKLSGLAHIRGGYTARLHETFSVDLAASYFMRTAKGAGEGWPITGNAKNDKYALGAEGYTAFVWNPVSDIQMSFGGGVFLPQLGDVAPKEHTRFSFELGMTMALY